MIVSFIFISVLLVHQIDSNSDKYCSSTACPGNTRNVGCGCLKSTYGPECVGKNARLTALSGSLRTLILDKHNKARNMLACGLAKPHPPAAKMIELTWNDELEFLASCNTMKCVYGHDSCRSTSEYPYAGQNIASKLVCGKTSLKVEDMIVSSVDAWFEEYKNTTTSMTDRYPQGKVPGGPIGHFTLLVNDMVRCIGCSYILYEEQRQSGGKQLNCQRQYLVCNYSYNNFIGEKTYTKSQKPATECKSRSAEHSCLCSSSK